MHNSGDFGFCPYVGHTGAVLLTWEDDTVVSVECSYGNTPETCGCSDKCDLYQRHPVGFVQTYPAKKKLL